jgi:cephalosporin hydroxylase
MPDLDDRIAVAMSKLYESEQRIWHLRTHIDPLGWKAMKAYVDNAIAYQMLLAQKEPTHA